LRSNASSVGFEAQRAVNGDYFIWLAPDVVNKLKALRGLGESFSDVVLKLAKGEGGTKRA
jgi:hypothetical protein